MKLKKILISQPEPTDLEKSPYKNLITKHGVELTFYKFFEVVGLTASDHCKNYCEQQQHANKPFHVVSSLPLSVYLGKSVKLTAIGI